MLAKPSPAADLSQAEPSQAEPESSRAEPNETEPSRGLFATTMALKTFVFAQDETWARNNSESDFVVA